MSQVPRHLTVVPRRHEDGPSLWLLVDLPDFSLDSPWVLVPLLFLCLDPCCVFEAGFWLDSLVIGDVVGRVSVTLCFENWGAYPQ